MSSRDIEEILDDIETMFQDLVSSEGLNADPIIRRPWGSRKIRLSWTGNNNICKNIIIEVRGSVYELWFEGNAWKDTRRGDRVSRRWQHFPKIDSLSLNNPELEDSIRERIEEAFQEVETVQHIDDLENKKKLDLTPSEINLLKL